MDTEDLARLIVESISRHGLRGLIYDAGGNGDGADFRDVVMHGHVNMLAVANDVLGALGS
ncbi:MAG TPA: hypothetical protein VJM34_17425 [Novosphingobium sp.]|nr:hypothetical protein [Novosphingobium sp.]